MASRLRAAAMAGRAMPIACHPDERLNLRNVTITNAIRRSTRKGHRTEAGALSAAEDVA